MTAPARFTKADVARVLSAAKQCGFSRVRVGIDVTGNIVLDASNDPAEPTQGRRNPLDRLLEA
jgi:hypothetical protein